MTIIVIGFIMIYKENTLFQSFTAKERRTLELSIKNVSKNYGQNKALSDFTMTFTQGIYALLGPNGSGKTTLMNIITDNLKRDSGTITHVVSDVEYIARSAVFLKKGVITDHGSPAELAEKSKGLVRTVKCDADQVAEHRKEYKIINIYGEGTDVRMRILSAERPRGDAENVPPTLEDEYIRVFDK